MAAVCAASLAALAHAQTREDRAREWQEAEVPPPPAFNTDRLARFQVSIHSALTYGVVPDSLSVGEDGVVRYVMVARSTEGAVNVMYDGVRCASAEMKTYARWSPSGMPLPETFSHTDGEWKPVERPEWVALVGNASARPALTLARAALCDGTTPNGDARRILRDLRTGRPRD